MTLSDDHPVTLTINGSQVSGTSACNSYGGEIVVQGGEVRFGDMMMTMMGCEEPASSIEAAYHLALGRIRVPRSRARTWSWPVTACACASSPSRRSRRPSWSTSCGPSTR